MAIHFEHTLQADTRKQKFTEHQLEPPDSTVYKDKWVRFSCHFQLTRNTRHHGVGGFKGLTSTDLLRSTGGVGGRDLDAPRLYSNTVKGLRYIARQNIINIILIGTTMQLFKNPLTERSSIY